MPNVVRFGYFEVDIAAGRLYKHGIRINLRDKSFQVLASLLEHPGEVVTRENLRQRLWRDDVFVDFDNNLNTAIARLREALGDSAEHPHFIETLPKRGYRFLDRILEPPRTTPSDGPKRARLVVLPFLNLNGDAAQEYFSDAMTDEIITKLATLAPNQLAVIARTTAMRYKDTHKDVARIGRELNLDYVVEGGVRRARNRVSVNVQLIRVGDQTHLFAQSYDIEMRDIFSLHTCIAQAIARHIPAVADALRRGLILRESVPRKPTEDLAAYNELIKGRYEMWKMTAESLAASKRHFEAALARDSGLAPACNALAELYWYLGLLGYAPSRDTDRLGRSYALRSMEADGGSAETHALLSFYPTKSNESSEIDYYNWAAIQDGVAHARALDPNSRLVRIRYAMVQGVLGHIEEAVTELERALEADPLSLDVRCWLAMTLYLGRHMDQTLAQAQQILDLEPEHFLPYYVLGYVYLALQKFAESAEALQKAVTLSHELPIMLGWLGLSLGKGGRRLESRRVLDRLRALAKERYVSPVCFAWAHLGLGEIDEAFLWLDKAVDAPDRMIEPIKTWPVLDPIRADPRFAVLLRKMNLGSE